MWHLAIPAWSLMLRSVVIYLALLGALRMFGKREVGQFNLFDLVLVLLAANAVQPAMTGPDATLLGGLIIMATLFLLNFLIARLDRRSSVLRHLVEGQPTVIARDGHWILPALHKEGIGPGDCMQALREHGMDDVREVGLAVLETDGTVSVVRRGDAVHHGRAQVRAPGLA